MFCCVCDRSTFRSASASANGAIQESIVIVDVGWAALESPPSPFSSSVPKEHRQSVPLPSLMTRIQFTRRPDRRGSALKSTPRALWHPWPSNHLSACGHLECRWSAWPTSFQAARKRMWIVHWADAQLGTSDAPPQQETSSQPKVHGEQSADIEVVAADPTARSGSSIHEMANLQGQLTSENIEHTSPYSEMPLCLPVCLSVSLSLIVCLCLCLSVRCCP